MPLNDNKLILQIQCGNKKTSAFPCVFMGQKELKYNKKV